MKNKKSIGFETTLAAKPQKQNISVSQVLVVQPPKRDTLDIGKRNSAVRSADRGKRAKLYEIYADIMSDPVIAESIRKRVRHVTNGNLQFLVDNKEVDEMTDFIQTPQFRILLREILLTKFFGKTVLELEFKEGFKVNKIPRTHLDTSKKVILKSLSDSDGIPYEDDDFLLNIGEDDDLGLLMESAPFAIFKRNGGADYAEFCELWGIPILAAMYDPEDEGAREEMEKTVENRGAGGSVVMSNKGKLEALQTKVNGAVHGGFLDWLDNQILIGLIGQTMTTKDGSSLSQSKTHGEVEDDINVDDRVYILEVLNNSFLQKIQKRGIANIKNGWFVYPQKDNLTANDKLKIAEAVDKITEAGVDDDYFYETFGLPKGQKQRQENVNNDIQNQQDENPKTGDQVKNESPKKETAKPQKVQAKTLSLFEKIKDFFDHAPL